MSTVNDLQLISQYLNYVDDKIGEAFVTGNVDCEDFVHLHTHSHYSLLDGIISPKEVVERAIELGHSAVAITDHGSMSAMPELFKYTEGTNIKPIVGCEFYVAEEIDKKIKRYHFNVFAKNWDGVKVMMAKLTKAWQQFNRKPIIYVDEMFEFDNCIVTSACAGGIFCMGDYLSVAKKLKDKYGDDFYVEIMPHVVNDVKAGCDIQKVYNMKCADVSRKLNVKPIFTIDAHYLCKEDNVTHDIFLCLQRGAKFNNQNRWKFSGDSYYMCDFQDAKKMVQKNLGYLSDDFKKDLFKNTVTLADKVNIQKPKFDIHLPVPFDTSGVKDVDSECDRIFGIKITKGYDKFIVGKVDNNEEYLGRLKHEIGIIKKLKLIRYFLIVEDIINWAESNGIEVGPGRGSAGGSLVCYLMGITKVDPIKYGLFFERFLNPNRADMADIDVDFQSSRRSEVFDYIREKYGEDKTAQIGTYTYLSPKSAFRDVCSVFDYPSLQTNILSKMIEDADSFESVPELINFANSNQRVMKYSGKLNGKIRHTGKHACGMVISSHPIDEVGVTEIRNETPTIAYDKKVCEEMGLLKMDVLALSSLDIIAEAKRLIRKHRGFDVDIYSLPLDDEATFNEFKKGKGVGVFQFEKTGVQKLLREVQPETIEDLAAITALYRPGPLTAMVDDDHTIVEKYVRIAQKKEHEKYIHSSLEKILGETNALVVYQEQVMGVFAILGGFTMAEADEMRKIIGRKMDEKEFEPHKIKFIEGCYKNGVEKDVSAKLFEEIKKFAGYAFNKSHSVEYAYLGYLSMYLKVHYPIEFMTAVLTYSTKDDLRKNFIFEAERLGCVVHMPQINNSTNKFEIIDGEIVAPLSSIKGVGGRAVEEIVKAREEKGIFLNRKDFVDKVYKRVVNVRVQRVLYESGCFEIFGERIEDPEEYEKKKMELIDVYIRVPRLTQGSRLDIDGLYSLMTDVDFCSKNKQRALMPPVFDEKSQPEFMVINKPQKKEAKHLTQTGTMHLVDTLVSEEIPLDKMYYTSYNKCIHGESVMADYCKNNCLEFLKKEILAVKPKVILLFDYKLAYLFGHDKKAKAADVNGVIVYSREYDAYVICGYTPQYAYYSDDETIAGSLPYNLKLLKKIMGY